MHGLQNEEYETKHNSKAIDKFITARLEVLCKNSKRGCNWTGVIVDFQNHSDTDCEFADIQCRFKGCNESYQRRHKKEHEESCYHKENVCKHCDQVIKVLLAEEHHGKCEMFPLQCSNEKCEETLPRNKMPTHQKDDCLYEEIKCPFNIADCKFKTLRVNMEEHTTKLITVHTQLMLQMQIGINMQDMNNRMQAMQTELQATKAALTSKEKELSECKSKLDQTMEELNLSKEDAEKKGEEIKLLRENLLKLDKQIAERFDEFKINHQLPDNTTIVKQVFKSLETKEKLEIQPENQIQPIIPIEINEMKLEFPKLSKTVQNLAYPYHMESYEEKFKSLLSQMENCQIYHIDDQQFIFKLRFENDHRNILIYYTTTIASHLKSHSTFVVFSKQNELVLMAMANNRNDYDIRFNVPNSSQYTKYYMINKNENDDKLLLSVGGWNDNVNMEKYKTDDKKEVLFHITK